MDGSAESSYRRRMLSGARVAVVVPAFREERLLPETLRGIPTFVDAVFVVDDASPDATSLVAASVQDRRVRVHRHPVNRGVGAAIATGYTRAFAAGADVAAVMAGDAQMDPRDLPRVLEPVVAGRADYVKGNRFVHPAVSDMPPLRRLGSSALSALTRAVTGLEVDDTQCGFTAIGRWAFLRLDLETLWPRYGYPNDILGQLAQRGLRVAEVPVRPVYGDESSGLRPWHVAAIAGVVLRRAAIGAASTAPELPHPVKRRPSAALSK
jgi:glycosyltransferase involved in cell wall biosynthesis